MSQAKQAAAPARIQQRPARGVSAPAHPLGGWDASAGGGRRRAPDDARRHGEGEGLGLSEHRTSEGGEAVGPPRNAATNGAEKRWFCRVTSLLWPHPPTDPRAAQAFVRSQ